MQSRCCSTLAATFLSRSRNPFLRSIFISAGAATGKEGSSGDISNARPQSSSIFSSSVAAAASDRRGLSLEAALSAVKRLDVDSKSKSRKVPHDPDSVVELFLSHGLTRSQIEKVIAMYPSFLLLNAKRDLKPKMDFLSGEIGLSGDDIASVVSRNTGILRSSIEKRIRPAFALLCSILGSKEHTISVLKRAPFLICFSPKKWIIPKLETLRGLGVSDRGISKLTRISPKALTLSAERFDRVIEWLKELGFSPTMDSYVVAFHAVSSIGMANLDRKLALFRSYGVSEDEILSGFRKCPTIATLSDQNIRNHMDFFLNNLKWKPQVIISIPVIMTLSLERRLIPRSTVRFDLLSRGFLDGSKANYSMFTVREDLFLQKYVAKFQNACPGLLDTYQKAKERALMGGS